MGLTSKGVHPYKVKSNPTKVSDALGNKIKGNVVNKVRKNTLCKSCN